MWSLNIILQDRDTVKLEAIKQQILVVYESDTLSDHFVRLQSMISILQRTDIEVSKIKLTRISDENSNTH